MSGASTRSIWASSGRRLMTPVERRCSTSSGPTGGTATVGQAHAVAAEISRWQNALWRFESVGHIGKVGGPKAWMEPVTPIVARRELRLKMPASSSGEVTLTLVAGDAGDGNEHDFVVWERPRLVTPGALICCFVMYARSFTSSRACVSGPSTRRPNVWTRPRRRASPRAKSRCPRWRGGTVLTR